MIALWMLMAHDVDFSAKSIMFGNATMEFGSGPNWSLAIPHSAV